MENLKVYKYEKVLVTDSRDVAMAVKKRHDNLIRDINGYIEVFSTALNFEVSEFFIPSTYLDSTGRELPCFLCTRKGCEMIANKLTGKKGVKFTAMYINRFHEMEQKLTQPQIPRSLPEALRLAADLAEQNEVLLIENVQKDNVIKILKPKAAYTDLILKSESLIKITQIAKDYGMSGKAMNKLLHDNGIQYKVGRQWVLYAQYENYGYTSSETYEFEHTNGQIGSSLSTLWTQKGRLFLYNFLKNIGIVPMIEKEVSA